MVAELVKDIWRIAKWAGFAILLASAASSCEQKDSPLPEIEVPREAYQFFVAGHIYGTADSAALYDGIYPGMYNWWPWLSNQNMAFAAFAGDVVPWNVPERWDMLEADLAELPMPKHLVPGNHDQTIGLMYDEFDRRFGPRYHSFLHQNDLFLFVDTETYQWRIPEAQLDWIAEEIEEAHNAENIFIVMHNLAWFVNDSANVHFNAYPNSFWNMGQLNFWEDLAPKLQGLPQRVYCFAGDTGRNCNGKELTYWNEGNLHLISTGMGCPRAGNFIVVKVDEEGNPELEVKWLYGFDQGSLEDHRYGN